MIVAVLGIFGSLIVAFCIIGRDDPSILTPLAIFACIYFVHFFHRYGLYKQDILEKKYKMEHPTPTPVRSTYSYGDYDDDEDDEDEDDDFGNNDDYNDYEVSPWYLGGSYNDGQIDALNGNPNWNRFDNDMEYQQGAMEIMTEQINR